MQAARVKRSFTSWTSSWRRKRQIPPDIYTLCPCCGAKMFSQVVMRVHTQTQSHHFVVNLLSGPCHYHLFHQKQWRPADVTELQRVIMPHAHTPTRPATRLGLKRSTWDMSLILRELNVRAVQSGIGEACAACRGLSLTCYRFRWMAGVQ